jgi:hypothetical protein
LAVVGGDVPGDAITGTGLTAQQWQLCLRAVGQHRDGDCRAREADGHQGSWFNLPRFPRLLGIKLTPKGTQPAYQSRMQRRRLAGNFLNECVEKALLCARRKYLGFQFQGLPEQS